MNQIPPSTWLAGRGWTVADLSLTIAESLPCSWPGHMPYQHRIHNWFVDQPGLPDELVSPEGGYYTATLVMDEHVGTHFDAPSHRIAPSGSGLPDAGPAGDIYADQVALTDLMGPAKVLDLRHLADPSGGTPGVSRYATAADVEAFEAAHGPIEPGDIVLIRSDWDVLHFKPGEAGLKYVAWPRQGKSLGWPAPDVSFIDALAERGVRCTGSDSPSMGSVHDGAPAHFAALSRGMSFIEGLGGLAAMPPTGALFAFLGLKLRGGSGAPGRAIGLIPAA
ncbi:MAG: cyclase family protein [Bifidobacteriaceae bacterium]|jgi:kynurenine formamidase|nr:cyclase family protein [Bifidobacteriaceae bacterium]